MHSIPEQTLEHVGRADGVLIRAALLVTSTLTVMAGATIAPALPAMQAAFPQADPLWIRLVLTLPALFIAAGAPIAGYIVDRFGRKRLLVFSTVLYAVSGGSGYVAPTLLLILVGRALLGLAVAGVMTSVTTLIADYYVGKERSQFMGLQAAFMGGGGSVFLALGGILADVGWRAPFLIYLLAFLVLPVIVTVLYEPDSSQAGQPATLPASTRPDANLPSSQETPVRLMIFVYATVAIVQIVFYLIPVQLPFYLADLVNASASQSGLAIAGMALFFALASSLFGWFDERLSHMTAAGLAFLLAGLAYLAIGQADGWWLLLIGLSLGGFGIGLIMPNLNVWLANEAPVHLRGRALGGFTTSVFTGQFISPIVTQPMVRVISTGPTYSLIGLLLTATGLLALVLIWLRRSIYGLSSGS